MRNIVLFKSDQIPVEFGIGAGGDLGQHAVNWMMSPEIWETDDEDDYAKFRLYAEIIIPDDIDQEEADEYGYMELLEEIHAQAKEHGLNPENIWVY